MFKVKAGHGSALELEKGKSLRLINTHGTQVVDLWAWNKSDLQEYAVKFLDGFGDFRRGTKWGVDVIQALKEDPKFVYDYLDYNIFTVPRIHAERFKQYNINFEYFDLDKGDYKKTFDLSRTLSRNLDNPVIHQLRNTKKKKEVLEKYFILYDIAEKYLKTRGRKDNRV